MYGAWRPVSVHGAPLWGTRKYSLTLTLKPFRLPKLLLYLVLAALCLLAGMPGYVQGDPGIFRRNAQEGIRPDSVHYTLQSMGTGWLYDSNVGNIFFYTPSGRAHPARNMLTDQIMIMQFKPSAQLTPSVRHMEDILGGFRQALFHFSPYTIRPTRIGDMDAFEVSCTTKYQGEQNSFYAVLTGTKAQPILFAGWTYEDREERMESIRKVAATLRVR